MFDGLAGIQDKAMPLDVLNGLTQTQTVSSAKGIPLPKIGTNIKFQDPYDHEAHKSEPVAQDLGNVQIEKTVTKKGKYCQPDQWAVV
jgi:hypothetical protein